MSQIKIFQIQHVDDLGNARELGELSLDSLGQIKLEKCDAIVEDSLNQIINKLNAANELKIKEGIATEKGSSIGWRSATRDADDFSWVVEQYFQQRYDLRLTEVT